MFGSVAQHTPSTVAVLDGERALRYRDLDELSDRVACALRALGAGPHAVIGLLMERSADAIVAVFGVLKSGAAFLPLDPAQPERQLCQMGETAGISLLLMDDSSLLGNSARTATIAPGCPAYSLDDLLGTSEPAESASTAPGPDHLAYVAYTSGSTQKPKAVGIRRHSLAVAADGWLDTYRLRGRPLPHLQCAGFGFDVFIQDLSRCLLSGGTLVICPPAVRLDPPVLANFMARHDIAFAEFTPSILMLLIEYLELAGRTLPCLQTVAVGGEPWRVGMYHRLARIAPGALIVNTYGLTESTIDNLAYFGPPAAGEPDDQLMPLGRPHPGTEIIVVDTQTGIPVTHGEGELYLTGTCLGTGYLGQPDLTAERFVPSPLDPARRALRTGDLVRLDSDGTLHYRGRRDDQVKIHGVRVAIGDVEQALAEHPAVAQAAVVAVATATGPQLIAHVVPSGGAPQPAELRERVRSAVAPEAVPSRIVFRDRLPVNINGKIDRARLDDPQAFSREADWRAAAVAPIAAAASEVTSQPWQQATGCPAPGPADNFFAQGGDSVSAARMLVRLGHAMGVQIPISALHEHPTFGDFTEYVAGLRTASCDVPQRTDRDRHPLSPSQHRLWLINKAYPEDTRYVVPTLVELVGQLDRGALGRALDRLVARHEPLRTVVEHTVTDEQGPAPECRIRPAGPVSMETAEAADEESARGYVATFLRRPFDLSAEPPLRVQLLFIGPRRHWLVLAIHHIATDGESNRIILDELGRLYTAETGGPPAHLRPLGVTYGDFAAWQHANLGTRLAAGLDEWRKRLGDYNDHTLALDTLERTQPTGSEGIGLRHSAWLGTTLTTAVRTVARHERTTVFVALLAAFTELMGRWSGATDVCVGYPVNARELPAVQGLVGFFVDTCVARVDLAGMPSYRTLIQRAHTDVTSAAASRQVPFELGVDAVAELRGSSRPLFRTWFNHLGKREEPPRMPGLDATLLDSPSPPALFDVAVYLTEHDGDIRIDLVHDTARCSDRVGRELLDQYVRLINAAVTDPGAPMRRHRAARPPALPDPVDRLDAPPAPDLARHLARSARTRSDSVAIRSADGERTYRELRKAVRRFARGLRDAGLRRGEIVAVHAPRGDGLVTAVLGTLAAGGRMLLVDPADPVARQMDQVAAVRPRLLVFVGTGGSQPPHVAVRCGLLAATADGALRWLRSGDSDLVPANLAEPGYVAFTSGTTGAPTAVTAGTVVLTHFLRWYTTQFGLQHDDRFALLAGLSHDPVFRDVLTPLWTGGVLCIPDPGTYRVPVDLLTWLRRERITVAHLTPPLARLLMDASEEDIRLPALRLLCLAGDTLTEADVSRLAEMAPNAMLINGYGTTETPQLHSWQTLRPGQTPDLGYGAPGSQLLVVDDDGQLCGIGEPGQIVIRSRHLTDELPVGPGRVSTPVPDPVPGVRRFHTGDLGRYRVDGAVVFLGRVDGIVKIRGHRVSLAEVDRALAASPEVITSITVPRPGVDGFELVSYVVPRRRGNLSPSRVRARLATLLPRHFVPAAIVEVDRLPLTANGKPDLATLRSTTPVDSQEPAGRDSPQSPLEHEVARIWSTILGMNRVGVDDNFFDLGGSSLALIRVHRAIRRELDNTISLLALYQYPTVRTLAQAMSMHRTATAVAGRSRRSATAERTRRLAARSGTSVSGPSTSESGGSVAAVSSSSSRPNVQFG
jgi:amino acid adenylation domain-containing protein